ncbi:AMP-binding protein [Nocardia grenadensis]
MRKPDATDHHPGLYTGRTPDDMWAEIEGGLSRSPLTGLNTAQEVCGRYASEPGRIALIVRHADGSSVRWTHRELYRAAVKTSSMFAAAGLRAGDRVAGLLSRQVESWIVALAAWRSGMVYVPMFSGFGVDAITYRVQTSEAALIVVDHRWRATLQAALSGLDSDIAVVTVTGPKGTGLLSGDRSFWAESERSEADRPEVPTGAKDPATLLFTSRGEPVAAGESGLIAIERPRYQLSIGYENRPEAWRARWIGNQFVTEDRARLRPDGRWEFLGRDDDMIATSGYNVSPVEVERVLCEHPGVAEAAAISAAGPTGTIVRAVIVRMDSDLRVPELERALRAEVTRRVGAHASPRTFDFVETLPRNEVGKLQRAVLRKV